MRKLRFQKLLSGAQSTLGLLTPARRPSWHPQATIVFSGEAQHGAESLGGAACGGPHSATTSAQPQGPGAPHRALAQGQAARGPLRAAHRPLARPRPSDCGLCSLLGARHRARQAGARWRPASCSPHHPSHTYCVLFPPPPASGWGPHRREKTSFLVGKMGKRMPRSGSHRGVRQLGTERGMDGRGKFRKTIGVRAKVVHREKTVGLRMWGPPS